MHALRDRTAIIHGGGGAIGGAVARAFAKEGARVFVAGRSKDKLDAVVRDIEANGGRAAATVIDALDEASVEAHAARIAETAGGIDIALDAVGFAHVQGVPFVELTLADFMRPVEAYTRSTFLLARAVSRHMAAKKAGVILTLSTPGAKLAGTGFLGNGVASGAIETMTRLIACELASSGIRVVCLRPHAIPEALEHGSHTREVFESNAARAGLELKAMLAGAAQGTLTRRLPTLDQVAAAAVFVASDAGATMSGNVVDLTGGAVLL